MSNPKNQSQAATKSSSKTNSTAPPKKAASNKTEEEPELELDIRTVLNLLNRTVALLERKDKALAPLEKFHEAVDGADEEDVRIYWDVHIVYGKNKPLKRVQGSSTLPSLLSEKLLPNAPSMIQQEIVEKVALPLTGLFMKEGEVRNPVIPLLENSSHIDRSIDPDRTSGGDAVMDLADEYDEVAEAEIVDEDDDDPDANTKARVESSERKEEERNG